MPGRSLSCNGKFESEAHAQGFERVAGVDEVGRGCWFGPVYAAAVILSPARPIAGLRDSKHLSAAGRERLAPLIRERATAWAVASVDAAEIDRIDILQASRLCMKLAVEKLAPRPDFIFSDAVTLDIVLAQRALVHGDALCRSIAAASILAKVERDASMTEWDRRFPEYGLARHKGYGTPEHKAALERFGPTEFHRFSFAPVRQSRPGESSRAGSCS